MQTEHLRFDPMRFGYRITVSAALLISASLALLWLVPGWFSSGISLQYEEPSPAISSSRPAEPPVASFLILPDITNAPAEYAAGYLEATFPEEYQDRLRSGDLEIVDLTATLRRKVHWPEHNRTVLLVGTHSESSVATAEILLPQTNIAVGGELVRRLRLDEGDPLIIQGHAYRILSCLPARNSADDETIWMRLDDCQRLLSVSNRITGLQVRVQPKGRPRDEIRRAVEGLLRDTRAY